MKKTITLYCIYPRCDEPDSYCTHPGQVCKRHFKKIRVEVPKELKKEASS